MASLTSELGETVCIPLGYPLRIFPSRTGQMALAAVLGFSGDTGEVGTSLLPKSEGFSLASTHTFQSSPPH